MINKVLGLASNVAMLIFLVLCGVDIIPMTMLGWLILCLFAILNCNHIMVDFFKTLRKDDICG